MNKILLAMFLAVLLAGCKDTTDTTGTTSGTATNPPPVANP